MEKGAEEARSKVAALPTPLSRRFVRYVLGFGVTVGLGLAPFLGKIAGLDALIELYPRSLQASLIPFSAFLMGFIAVGIQFYSGETLRRDAIRRRFGISWLLMLAGLILLLVFYNLFILPIQIKGGETVVPVVIGNGSRLASCGCPPAQGDKDCILRLGLSDAAIESCWDSRSIRSRSLLLSLSYLAVMGGFAALVGLLLLQEEARKKGKRQSAARTSPAGSA